jgi:hypothetical protein
MNDLGWSFIGVVLGIIAFIWYYLITHIWVLVLIVVTGVAWEVWWLPLRQWRAVPLPLKSMARATFGGFLLALCIGATATGTRLPGGTYTLEGVFAVGLLYLCAGMFGSRSRFDVMSVFWWSALALGCSAGVAWYEGIIP